jgi:hypothetical protein
MHRGDPVSWDLAFHGRVLVIFLPPIISAERFHEIETGKQWRIHYRLSSGQM